MTTELNNFRFKEYLDKILSASAIGIVICVISTAILYELFTVLSDMSPIFIYLKKMIYIMQFLTPAVIGVLVGISFKFDAMRTSLVSITAFLVSRPRAEILGNSIELYGMGDILNVIFICFISVVLIQYIGNKCGSVTILVLPLIICGGIGLLGLYSLNISIEFTKQLGLFIASFTKDNSADLSLITYVLLSVAFSIIIILPLSTIGMASIITIGGITGLDGLHAGASALGITACAAVMTIGSAGVNKNGLTVSIFVGTIKLMMPNLFKNPILALPVITNAMVVGIFGYFLEIQGNTTSSGYGIIGMIAPIEAFKISQNIFNVLLAFIVIPFASAFAIDYIYRKLFKLYDKEIFSFVGFPSTKGIKEIETLV